MDRQVAFNELMSKEPKPPKKPTNEHIPSMSLWIDKPPNELMSRKNALQQQQQPNLIPLSGVGYMDQMTS